MSVVINTNFSATLAANNLAASNGLLQRSLNRLSSGSKIVSPADDAGGLAVSMKLSAAAKRQGAVNSNIGNSVSFLQSQDGVLKTAGKVLERIGELKTLASDPTKNTSDLANYNAEFTALKDQLTSLAGETFNGVSLFGSNSLTVGVTEDGTGTVTAEGVQLLGTPPAFPTLSDNFADLSNWTDDSFGGSAYVSGNELNLDGAFGIVTTNQSFSDPFEINLEYRSKNIGDIFSLWLGDTGTIIGAANPGDTAWHSMRIVFDGTTANAYIDGSPTASMTTNPSPDSGPIQLSSNAANGVQVRSFSIASTEGGGSDVGNVTSATDLSSLSLSSITSALSDIATYRANNGAQQSRLGFASEVLATNKANLEAANSRIVDVDVAEESTQLARYNILVQAGTAMLSQANQSAQSALRLIG